MGSCFLQARCDERWVDVLRIAGHGDAATLAALDQLKAIAAGRNPPRAPLSPAAAALKDAAGEPPVAATGRPPGAKTAAVVMALMRPFWGPMALLLSLSVAAVAIEVVPPMLQRVLVDDVLQVQRPTSGPQRLLFLLLAIVGGLLLIRLSAGFLAVWKGWVSSRVGAAMTARLRIQLVEKLSQLPLAFYDRHQVGELMSQVAYDTETLHTLLYHVTSGFLLQSLNCSGSA